MPPTVTTPTMLTTPSPLCGELECNNDDDDYVRKVGIAILSMIGFGILFCVIVHVVMKISDARKRKAQRKQAAQDLLKNVVALDGATDTDIEMKDITYVINALDLTGLPAAITKDRHGGLT